MTWIGILFTLDLLHSEIFTKKRRFFQFENLDEAVVREVMVQTGPIQHAVFSVRQNYCWQFGKNARQDYLSKTL